jgi:hypothetical protein
MRITAVATVALVTVAGVASGASRPASRILDRSVTCKTAGEWYPDRSRYMQVNAAPRLGEAASTATFVNGSSGPEGVYLNVEMGAAGAVRLSRIKCKRTTIRVPLENKTLQGGTTDFGERYSCEVPATILMRVRAVFRNPVTFGIDPYFPEDSHLWVARGKIRTASLVVTTKSKKPIALATLKDATGKAAVFTSPSRCR